jgi:predicted permease
MFVILTQMFVLIGLGLAWAVWRPPRVDIEASRRLLADSVFYLFLPALVLQVLWRAALDARTLVVAGLAALGVFAGLVAGLLLCRLCRTERATTGAILLAAAWPNATYLGLPVLEKTFGPWARSVAISYDLFACTPLLFTLGVLIARRFGGAEGAQARRPREGFAAALLRVPPFWAALAAAGLNLGGLPMPGWIDGVLGLLGAPVVPLMLIIIGMALREGLLAWRRWPAVLPVIAVQLFFMPLAVWAGAALAGLEGAWRTAVVLEAAMPSMMFGIVLADRYGLDAGVYAAALTVTTLLSLLTLPLWHAWAG